MAPSEGRARRKARHHDRQRTTQHGNTKRGTQVRARDRQQGRAGEGGGVDEREAGGNGKRGKKQ